MGPRTAVDILEKREILFCFFFWPDWNPLRPGHSLCTAIAISKLEKTSRPTNGFSERALLPELRTTEIFLLTSVPSKLNYNKLKCLETQTEFEMVMLFTVNMHSVCTTEWTA